MMLMVAFESLRNSFLQVIESSLILKLEILLAVILFKNYLFMNNNIHRGSPP